MPNQELTPATKPAVEGEKPEGAPVTGAPKAVVELVARFEQQLDSYKSGQYNETQVRREFLDPFFKALGWDIDNEQGYAEAYKDVIHEDAIRISGANKSPDYCFRIGGTRKYYLEAKRPSVDIKEAVSPAHQLRSYGWTQSLPLCVLSDFEEFAVHDCRFKPLKTDKASVARIFYCTFREYAEKWAWINSIFSREAVLKGWYDKFAVNTKSKRGTTDFDEDFLAEIEGWRRKLAENLALRNPRLSQRDLNFAVQRIIDRIIFLRICEGRGIEDYGRLQALINGERTYPRLVQLFEDADKRYNSGLFHFQQEPGRHEEPDELTVGLDIDDKLLRDIFKSLYYPDSPYQFSVIPADILGQVYERFLGKIIRLTDGHRAEVDEKPEVKKAGGVYYTPTYIVDYIVQQTVGKLVEDKTPKQVEKIRILDPACGSGSFLIGAYQFLLDWHLKFYLANDPEKWARGAKPALVQAGKSWKLTIDARKRILLNNIYGVDIDPQAVEVTKLSLLLKVLEGETGQALQTVLRSFNERALPDLGDNIKCGNSLIGPDFYQQGELPLLTDDEKYRINVFDWRAEFPAVFQPAASTGELREAASIELDYPFPAVPLHGGFNYKKIKVKKTAPSKMPAEPEWEGGFDAVIGNPPYIRIQTMQDSQPQEVEYFGNTYQAASQGNYDIYVVFVERGLKLLNKSGRLGFIIPNKFFRTDYGEGLRRLVSDEKAVSRIVDFGASQVFRATTYTCLLFLQKGRPNSVEYGVSEASVNSLSLAGFSKHESKSLSAAPWTFESRGTASLLAKLEERTIRLLDLPADMSRGSSTGDDEIFVFENGTLKIEREIVREPLFASDFGRYEFSPAGKWKVIFPYVSENGVFRLYTEQELKRRFPRAYAYLLANQPALKRRKQFKEWFGYSAPRNLALHDRAQIAVPLLADGGLFACLPARTRGKLCPMASGGFTVTLSEPSPLKPEYVLGLLNSRLLFWRLQAMSNVFRGGWITCTKQYFGELPVRKINFSDKSDRAMHDRLVKLVEQMLALNPQLAAARTPQEKTALERQTAATDAQIDQLAYQLYGLTPEEIKIVEGKAERQPV